MMNNGTLAEHIETEERLAEERGTVSVPVQFLPQELRQRHALIRRRRRELMIMQRDFNEMLRNYFENGSIN